MEDEQLLGIILGVMMLMLILGVSITYIWIFLVYRRQCIRGRKERNRRHEDISHTLLQNKEEDAGGDDEEV